MCALELCYLLHYMLSSYVVALRRNLDDKTQQTFTGSKSTIETLEKGTKYVQR